MSGYASKACGEDIWIILSKVIFFNLTVKDLVTTGFQCIVSCNFYINIILHPGVKTRHSRTIKMWTVGLMQCGLRGRVLVYYYYSNNSLQLKTKRQFPLWASGRRSRVQNGPWMCLGVGMMEQAAWEHTWMMGRYHLQINKKETDNNRTHGREAFSPIFDKLGNIMCTAGTTNQQ